MKNTLRSFVLVVVVFVASATLLCAQGAIANPSYNPTVPASSGPTVSPATAIPPGDHPAAGASPAAPAGAGSTNPASPAPPDLQIGSGDLLLVTVFGVSDFNQQVRVSGSGDVSLPPLDSVHVAGLTTKEAEGKIRKLLMDGGFFNDPRVSVFEQEYATQGISVLGEVNKPGVYPLQGSRRLLDFISAAGGLTPRAGRSVSVTHRSDTQHPVTYNMPRDPEKSAASNIEISPGDTIWVSTAGIVYVVGDVVRPAGFVMDTEKLTVLQVMSLAGGANSTAALNEAKLIRQRNGQRSEVKVQLKQILQAKAEDVALERDDILFVPRSMGKAAVHGTLDAVVRMATGAVIYWPRP